MKQTILALAAVLSLVASARASGTPEPEAVRTISVDPTTLRVDTNVAMAIVPEPSTLALYAVGAIGLLIRNRRAVP